MSTKTRTEWSKQYGLYVRTRRGTWFFLAMTLDQFARFIKELNAADPTWKGITAQDCCLFIEASEIQELQIPLEFAFSSPPIPVLHATP